MSDNLEVETEIFPLEPVGENIYTSNQDSKLILCIIMLMSGLLYTLCPSTDDSKSLHLHNQLLYTADDSNSIVPYFYIINSIVATDIHHNILHSHE